MKETLLIIGVLIASLCLNAQTTNVIDTIHGPVGLDTVFYFQGYTDNIVGILIDFRTIDDTTDARISFGAGWSLFDTTFLEIIGPAPIEATNDYIFGFEKQGIGFSYPRLKFTKGSSSEGLKYPVKVTYDR